MVVKSSKTDEKLIAHLLRRAGFGGTYQEICHYSEFDYENVVDQLLESIDSASLPDDLIRRYHINQSDLHVLQSSQSNWFYRMVSTDAPIVEKMALLWHRVFATGLNKLIQGKPLSTQLDMFRNFGLGSFRDLLVELSKDPAMIMWLDNQDNHKDSINENYGRELLELFSMGVGNYTEDDVKACARAFTGWTVANTDYMAIRMRNSTTRPYGFIGWQFKYDHSDHDDGEKTFLGKTGNFNGEDVIDIICEQPATAKFIARHIYNHFVADELPVPQWPHFPPKDPETIGVMTDAFFESNYSIKAMLRALFLSDPFKSQSTWNARVKSPSELIVGTLKLIGGYDRPSSDVYAHSQASVSMGQSLLNPPSVEGWMGGVDWISTGPMVERVNFASDIIGDLNRRGVVNLIADVRADCNDSTPEVIVSSCLRHLGLLELSDETYQGVVKFCEDGNGYSDLKIASLLQLIVATREYQFN